MKRRPPDPRLLDFLTAYDRTITDLALALREIILEEQPDASESVYQVYTVAIWFGFSGKMKDMFCYITTHAGHIDLGFPRGANLPDPNRVLEGEGKAMRHIKFTSMSDPSFVATSRQRSSRWARPRQAEPGRLLSKRLVSKRVLWKNRLSAAAARSLERLVDLVGVEPTTSSMPWKRAPNCATGPLF